MQLKKDIFKFEFPNFHAYKIDLKIKLYNNTVYSLVLIFLQQVANIVVFKCIIHNNIRELKYRIDVIHV